jgi:MFS family permease
MPDRLTSRAALAVLLLLLTIAGIRAAGPAVSIRHVALPVVIGIGCALEAVLAVLLIALRWRPRGTAGAAARLRLLLTGVIVTGLIAAPAAMLIAGFTHIRPRRRLREHRTRFGGHPTRLHLGRHGHAATSGVYVQYVLFALLIMAIIVAAILIWRRRRRWLLSARSPEVADEDTDTPAELARAVDSGRVALRELDDARAAIIGCYLAMEESLADVGATRHAAETPDELLDRAAGAGLVDAGPAGRLTALFYEARFSTHPMPPARRDEAEHALADMAASLSPHNQAPASAGPSEGQR